MHKIIGIKTNNIYFTGDAIACRRFINASAEMKRAGKGKSTKVRSVFGFSEALRIV